MAITELSASKLRRHFNAKTFPFKTTDELTPLDSIIGQDRALKALQLGLEMDASGYNIFITGSPETGKTSIIENTLQRYAAKRNTPNDWCYVYNFGEQDVPRALSLPAGKGKVFRRHIADLINTLEIEIRRAFGSEHYENQKSAIMNQLNQQKRQMLQELEEKAIELSLKIQPTSMGFQTIPIKDGEPLTQEAFQGLSKDEREDITQKVQKMEVEISETLRNLARLEMRFQKSLQQLDKDVASFVVEQYVNEIKETYKKHRQVTAYLEDVCKDVVANSANFIDGFQGEGGEENLAFKKSFMKRYQVNVVVDNSQLKGAPVIYETNPTFTNLIGRIEKYPVQGSYVTDFTMIKAGSLLKANGGYLMIDAIEMLRNPFVYDALKRSLKNKQLRIEDASELYGTLSVASLKPEPIPLDLKVLVIGWSRIYHELSRYDETFTKIFKIRADFDYETDSTPTSVMQYAQFIKRVIDQEKLPPFTREAVEEIVQYGHRLAGEQEKLSLRFGQIVKMLQQSAFWAGKQKAKMVDGKHVLKAIIEFENRHNMIQEKILEAIKRNRKKIVVVGAQVGEINALSVISWGDFAFGQPNRITAKTYIGNDSLVSIDRKAGLTGKIHDKGSYILSGFFNAQFGEYAPVAFSASLTFEQSFSKIDGDSASSTELYALLSSLSGVPIKQGIAVTGSVNQNGEIQAIGGVNEKIEGFFEICRHKGLTGEQGVMIPRSNVSDLVLKETVREAVAAGKFHIWAVDTVDDGLEVLTGAKAGKRNKSGKFTRGSIYAKVEERMRLFSERAEKHRKSLSDSQKKNAEEPAPPKNDPPEENPPQEKGKEKKKKKRKKKTL